MSDADHIADLPKEERRALEAEFDNLGGGIKTESPVWPVEPKKEEEPKHKGKPNTRHKVPYNKLLDDDDKEVWSLNPSYPDQFARYPETVRKAGPTLHWFDIADKQQLEELNKLRNGQQNQKAPRNVVMERDCKFDEKTGCWKILVDVVTFYYLKILEKD